MTKPLDFSGPYLKTERAEHHIDQLKAIFERYVAQNKEALTPKYNRKPRPRRRLGSGFPRHTPTILGDALHNLRAALDHAYCELIHVAGTKIEVGDHAMFPIHPGGDAKSVKGSINGHIMAGKGPSRAIEDYIVNEIQPYSGGRGNDLCSLHSLDIADKHIVLLPTQQQMDVDDVMWENGVVMQGIRLVHQGNPSPSFAPTFRTHPGYKNKASFDICFGNGQPFEGKPILPILEDLHARVNETLRSLEQKAKETS